MYNVKMVENNDPISRRRLFREGFTFLGRVMGEFVEASQTEPAGDEDDWNPFEPDRAPLRPPGAVSEFRFHTLCDRCDDCIRACPENVLYHAPAEYGLAQGTPVFKPSRKPCYLCTELHCIKACPTKALVMVESVDYLKMGVARLDSSKCKAYEGKECRYCMDFCPLAGKAIIMLGGRPLIRAPECVGCGQCEYHCLHDAGRRAIVTLGQPLTGPGVAP